MKKNFLTIASICGIFLLSSFCVNANPADDHSTVNEKVLKSFHSVFNGASNVQWAKYGDHFSVSFLQDQIIVRAEYDKEGNLLSSISYYKRITMSFNFLINIKKEYGKEKI